MFGTDDDLEREHKILRNLENSIVRGVIITPISEEDDATLQLLRQFEQDGIPVVLIDRDVREHQFDGVFSNDIEGVRSGGMSDQEDMSGSA